MTEAAELLLHGGWVWTGKECSVDAEPNADLPQNTYGLLQDAAVYCRGGRIVEIGQYPVVRAKYPAALELGGANAIVLPGLINAHHHGRGLDPALLGSPDASLEVWLANRAGEPLVDPYLDTLWAAAQLLARGVTTIVHFLLTPDPDQALEHAEARLRAWQDAGIRVALGLDVRQQRNLAYEDEWALRARIQPGLAAELSGQEARRRALGGEEYLALFTELSRRHGKSPNTDFFLAPAGPQWVTDETLELIADHSFINGTLVHTHALETPYQREAAKNLYSTSVVNHLSQLGLLGPRTSLIHAVWVDERDIGLLASTGTNIVHNPGSNLRLSSGIAPVPALLNAGVNVALGTDGFTVGPDDLLTEARLAYHLHRLPGVAPSAPRAHQFLHAITAGAAATTPFGRDIGTLAVGGAADLTVVDLEAAAAPYTAPGVDPLEVLLQRADGSHVLATVVAGEVVAQDGTATRVSLPELAAELVASVQHRSRELSNAVAAATRHHYRERWRPSLVTPYWSHNGK